MSHESKAWHSVDQKLDPSWYYTLVVPDDEPDPLLIFQGYTTSSLALPRLVYAVMQLLPTIHSHQHDPETLAKYRLCSSHQLRCGPLMIGSLPQFPFNEGPPLQAFLSCPETDKMTAEILSKVARPVLHLSSDHLLRIVDAPHLGPQILLEHARKVAEYLAEASPLLAGKILSELDKPPAKRKTRPIPHPKNNHNVTIPNEVPIELSGGCFRGIEPFSTFDDSGYIGAIRHSSLFMRNERNRLHGGFPENFCRQTTEVIIACPGLLHHLSSASRFKKTFSAGDASVAEIKKAFRLWTRQEGYATKVSLEEAELLVSNPIYQIFSEEWAKEVNTFTAALMFQAFNEFCPVIRLPRKAYRVRGEISQLGKLLRRKGSDPKSSSINKLTNRICKEMEKAAGGLLEGFVEGHDKHIRVAADIPLGWIQSDGMPLALRHNVSQIPTTPGGLFMALSLITTRRFFNIGVRQHVLVIRSFQDSDPLRGVLEDMINQYKAEEGWNFEVEFIDVTNESEFVTACGRIRSPFLIFDGHGSHSEESQIGSIRIGESNLDVWQLRGKVAMPPMVLLSCCDAAPSDRSHANTANGFLTLGARSVFAPLFPVDGESSALMVARLLYRITTVARAWTKEHRLPLSWAQIVTGQVRACYTTDLLLQLVAEGRLTKEHYHEITPLVTRAINEYYPKWHDVLKTEVMEKLGWSADDYDDYLVNHYTIPQSLHYLQLGFPDKLLLCTEEFISKDTGGPDQSVGEVISELS